MARAILAQGSSGALQTRTAPQWERFEARDPCRGFIGHSTNTRNVENDRGLTKSRMNTPHTANIDAGSYTSNIPTSFSKCSTRAVGEQYRWLNDFTVGRMEHCSKSCLKCPLNGAMVQWEVYVFVWMESLRSFFAVTVCGVNKGRQEELYHSGKCCCYLFVAGNVSVVVFLCVPEIPVQGVTKRSPLEQGEANHKNRGNLRKIVVASKQLGRGRQTYKNRDDLRKIVVASSNSVGGGKTTKTGVT